MKLDPGAFLQVAKLGKTAKRLPKRLERLFLLRHFRMSETDAIKVVGHAPRIPDFVVKLAGLLQIRERFRMVALVLVKPRDVVQDVGSARLVSGFFPETQGLAAQVEGTVVRTHLLVNVGDVVKGASELIPVS